MTVSNGGGPIARPAIAAGVIFRSEDGTRILLVKPTYKSGWDLPGGYVEPGESPRAAAEREVEEELGIQTRVGSLLAVDWAPHPAEGDKILFVFDGGELPPALISAVSVAFDEIEKVALQPVAHLDGLMPRRLSDRIRAALTSPVGAYLEHGHQPNELPARNP